MSHSRRRHTPCRNMKQNQTPTRSEPRRDSRPAATQRTGPRAQEGQGITGARGPGVQTRALFSFLFFLSSSPTFTLELLREFWWSTGARGKAVVRVVAADRAGNDGLERGVRGTFLGFRHDSRFFGSLIAFLSNWAMRFLCEPSHDFVVFRQ
ncbi:hypothetical protein Taro_016358 [Colocasia esculenta]|uniref:Uncharacterized protein n=1 Tax=Colocasia esculenta TaxID=4460 RepID=A0A843UDN4_COLES|nr:hypothetical protein [Colocasia esculenta]